MNDRSTLPDRRPDDDELLAYAEGRLPADTARGRQIAAWLQRDKRAHERVMTCRAQDQAIRRHYARVLAEPIPERLQIAVVQRRLAQRDRRWRLMAAASIAAGVLLTAVWTLQPPKAGAPETSELDRFAGRISQQMLAVSNPDRDSVDALQPLTAGDPTLPLPGYTAAGTRQLQMDGIELREVQYRDVHGRHLSLFVGEPLAIPADPVRWQRAGDTRIVYWEQDGRLYALAGELPQDVLGEVAASAVAETAQQQYAGAAPDPSTDTFSDLGVRPLDGSPRPAPARPVTASSAPAQLAEPVQLVGNDGARPVEALAPDTSSNVGDLPAGVHEPAL